MKDVKTLEEWLRLGERAIALPGWEWPTVFGMRVPVHCIEPVEQGDGLQCCLAYTGVPHIGTPLLEGWLIHLAGIQHVRELGRNEHGPTLIRVERADSFGVAHRGEGEDLSVACLMHAIGRGRWGAK